MPDYGTVRNTGSLPLEQDSIVSETGQRSPWSVRDRPSEESNEEACIPWVSFPSTHVRSLHHPGDGVETLHTPYMRSMRLIGNSNPRYRW